MHFSRYRLGILLLCSALPAGAQTVAQQALTMTPKQTYDMCVSSSTGGKPDAIEWCTIALNSHLTPDLETICFAFRGIAYEKRGDNDAALQDLNTAVMMASGRHMVMDNHQRERFYRVKDPTGIFEARGKLHFKMKNFSDAIQDFTEVIQRKPSTGGYYNRGQAYFQNQNWDAAIGDYSDAIRLDANSVAAFKARGLAYRNKKDTARALADFTEVSRLRPNDPDGPVNRGLIYAEMGDLDRAVQELDAALALSPNNADIQETRNAVATLKNAKSYVDANLKVVAGRRDVIQAADFSDGLAAVCISEGTGCRWHYIDSAGKVAIRTNLVWTSGSTNLEAPPPFSSGLAATNDGTGKLAYMDKIGALVIRTNFPAIAFPFLNKEFQFNGDLGPVCDEFLPANNDGRSDMCSKWGYIDRTGKVVVPVELSSPLEFSEGLAVVYRNGKNEYIDNKNHLAIPSKFDSALPFSDGVAAASLLQKWVLIDKAGKVLCALPKDNSYGVHFSEGLSPAVAAGRYGFMDKACRIVIPAQFDQVGNFSEGLAAFQQGEKWGYLDKTGKVAIPAQFEGPGDFKDGVARIYQGNESRYIDKTGKFVPKPGPKSAAEPIASPASGGALPATAAASAAPPAPSPTPAAPPTSRPAVSVDAQVTAYGNEAYELQQKGDPAGAVKVFREMLRLKPEDTLNRHELAKALMDSGQFEAAIPEVEIVIARNSYYWYRYTLVQALGGAGRVSDAEAQLVLFAKAGAKPSEVQWAREIMLGRDAARKGDDATAIAHFLKANELAGGPNDDRMQIDLARALARTGQKEAALRVLDEAAKRHRYSPVLSPARKKLIAEMESASSQSAPTAGAGQAAAAAKPDPKAELAAQQSYEQGMAAWNRFAYAQAIPSFHEAVRLAPNNAEYQHQLGFALSVQFDNAGAVVHLRKATELDPQKSIYFAHLGDALSSLGKNEDAVKAFDKGLALTPDDPYMLAQRARASAR